MPDWFQSVVADNSKSSPGDLILHLLLAVALGGAVAFVYRWTRRDQIIAPTFPATLVLLAVLIAMVTHVIGESVARAFSLVGALSIVRFRTVVRDTKDTAFVILAVIVGMAVGANHLLVALVGLPVVSLAAWVMRPRRLTAGMIAADCTLSLRVGIGCDAEAIVRSLTTDKIEHYEVVAVSTAKQGDALDVEYQVRLRPGVAPAQLVAALNATEGVANVELRRLAD